jgi:hypothetical protein
MLEEINKRILDKKKKIFLAGAMGSGKTEISVNLAGHWSKYSGRKTGLIDLDMVKPYFRLRSVEEKINRENPGLLEVIVPDRKLGYADVPIITPQTEAYIVDLNRQAVIDVGGDDVGARLMGRYHNKLRQDDIEFWYVYNSMRPLSRGERDVMELMNAIERASQFKLTGLVNNSNLMGETTVEILEKGMEYARLMAQDKSIPVVFHCVREDLFEEVSKKLNDISLLPLHLYLTPEWV